MRAGTASFVTRTMISSIPRTTIIAATKKTFRATQSPLSFNGSDCWGLTHPLSHSRYLPVADELPVPPGTFDTGM